MDEKRKEKEIKKENEGGKKGRKERSKLKRERVKEAVD